MVGGKVVEVIVLPDKVWVNTQERIYNPHARDFRLGQTCAIYIARLGSWDEVKVGDSLWWQGTTAYWTPWDHSREDVPIPRIGYSGVERPAQ